MSAEAPPGHSEFERLVRSDRLPPEPLVLTANEAEKSALAKRFGLPSLSNLEAQVTLEPEGLAVRAKGRITASFEQLCAITQDPFAVAMNEQVDLIFLPEEADKAAHLQEEIELEEADLDTVPFAGRSFDLGEQIAQTLGLAIDPYAEGPGADVVREKAGIVRDDEAQSTGPLAEALAALKKD